MRWRGGGDSNSPLRGGFAAAARAAVHADNRRGRPSEEQVEQPTIVVGGASPAIEGFTPLAHARATTVAVHREHPIVLAIYADGLIAVVFYLCDGGAAGRCRVDHRYRCIIDGHGPC